MSGNAPLPYLALDIGAASGRAMLCSAGAGAAAGGPLELREVHRFPNGPVPLGGVLYWDFLRIWDNVLEALRRCTALGHRRLAGIGVDAWNVDFGLVDSTGALVRNPMSYRSLPNAAVLEEVRGKIAEEELYGITGFPYSPITGLARLLELRTSLGSGCLGGLRILPIPDLVRHFLCGSTDMEETVLWGTQLADVRTRAPSPRLMELFGLPAGLLPPVVAAGSPSGELLPEVRKATGIEAAPVFTVAGHDTTSAALAGAAVGAAAGLQAPGAAGAAAAATVLCTGSWFVLGVLLPEPRTEAACLAGGAANEIAPLGQTFLARNMMGFFLLEELTRQWRITDPDISWASLFREAEEAPAFGLCVDSNDPVFFSSTNAAQALGEHLLSTGQDREAARGAVARAILEGLVLSCSRALLGLEVLTGSRTGVVTVVGGGARNPLLCRMLADALGRPVAVGQPEATVLGNAALQMLGRGELGGAGQISRFLARGFPGEVYAPGDGRPWRDVESATERRLM
jgi:rhamnulokinase